MPTISGTALEADVLKATTGTWSNTPTGYAYVWQNCDSSGTTCAAITGATSKTYTLTATDVGQAVRVVVTACG
jgi:large repetitive protein